MLECTNPDTVMNIACMADCHFLYSFCALGASIEGFKLLRPVVVVDATHLKGVYEAKIYVVLCADRNDQIFSLSFGFGDEESNESWEWFMRCLRLDYG